MNSKTSSGAKSTLRTPATDRSGLASEPQSGAFPGNRRLARLVVRCVLFGLCGHDNTGNTGGQ
jgi:hypothetical protein